MEFFTKHMIKLNPWLVKLLPIGTIFTIIVGISQVTASSYGQKINLRRSTVTIKKVFDVIKQRTGYNVLWQSDEFSAGRKIEAEFNDATLDEVMDVCLKDSEFTYRVDDKTIILKRSPIIRNAMQVEQKKDSIIFKGKVVNENGIPLISATVRILESSKVTKTDNQGNFRIYGPLKGILQVTYLGYLNSDITLNGLDPSKSINIKLIPGANNLGEVTVVSTGLQDLPKERATGSFEVITKEQLQHSNDPNLIKRLEGLTTSMNFNNNLQTANSGKYATSGKPNPLQNLTIRGRTSLSVPTANNESGLVLVVIDGIASPYPIDQVDPNDVESITILKDAAAASIWGSRAANGVIVVKTKRGAYQKSLNVSFNTNFNSTEKLNLFYKNYMSTSEFINAQVFQYNSANPAILGSININNAPNLVSPVVEILNARKQGLINQEAVVSQLDILRGNDIRKDFEKYIMRNSFSQNYSLGIDGGSKKIAHRLSASYNHSINNTINSNADRLALNYSASYRLSDDVELTGNVSYANQTSNDQAGQNTIAGDSGGSLFYPYSRLADENGNSLVVPRLYRPSFIDLLESTYGDKILDMRYRPLIDINQGYTRSKNTNMNFNLGTLYKLTSAISANLVYNYNSGTNDNLSLLGENSFYMRNLINYYTSPGTLTLNIPLGGLYTPSISDSHTQSIRGQMNLNKSWLDKHNINAIAGFDISESYSKTRRDQYYGFNENSNALNNQLNFVDFNRTLWAASGISSARIPYSGASISDTRIRTYSLFANSAYNFKNRYSISGSIRKDMNSNFGLGTNKGGTPFYSVGFSWNIENERFYNIKWLPKLKLRSTYGYNGNVNPQVSARPQIFYNLSPNTAGLFDIGTILYATNLQLRPEKTGILNLGLDFALRDNRLSGSLEYYDKKTNDLLNSAPVDPTTGFNLLTFNTANIHGYGIDVNLNSRNLKMGLFSWTSTFLFSYNRVKVTKLYVKSAETVNSVVNDSSPFNVGFDLSRLFAYRWAGLDPITGDPMGYLNGKPVPISNNNTGANNAIAIASAPASQARYFGSAVPVYYGSLRNTFSFGNLSISANVLYKLGYYFRRPSSDLALYNSILTSNILQGSEYSLRWQKPGDEIYTNVPSLSFPAGTNRDSFYRLSEINVSKADHVRLQEINFSYGFNNIKWFVKNAKLYANVTNLGILWRANRLGLDPDILDYPTPKTYSLGISANF